MIIKKLFQALINCILLPDEEYDEVVIPKTIVCKTCRNNTAELVSYSGTFALYTCYLCHASFGGKPGEGKLEEMGKKKNKQKKGKKVITRNKQIFTKPTTTQNDSWEVKIDCVKECSKIPDEVTIWVHPLAKRKIDAMMEEYKNIEWLAYLLGDKENREAKDIFIPDQTITAASVDEIDCEEFNDMPVIGVIHSHHNMGHSFSGTDHEWINQNHDISLVISNSGIAGQCRLRTDCGAYKIVKTNVKLKVDIDFDDKAFIESIKDKLQRKTYATYAYGYGDGYGWPNYGSPPAHGGFNTGAQVGSVASAVADDDTNSFLSEAEEDELEREIEELDFEKELSLAEELELLKEVDTPDDVEAN